MMSKKKRKGSEMTTGAKATNAANITTVRGFFLIQMKLKKNPKNIYNLAKLPQANIENLKSH